MKNVRLIIPLAVAVLLICVMIWWRYSRADSSNTLTGAETTKNPGTENAKPDGHRRGSTQRAEDSNATDFAQASAEQQRQITEMGITPEMTKEQIQRKLEELHRIQRERVADKWRNPIGFFGKVIDERTNPIAQAAVTFIWNDTSESGSSKSNTLSDQSGGFSLGGVTGRGLSVYVEKQGYYEAKQLNLLDFDYSEGFIGDSLNPVVFHLRKKGEGTDLITSQYGMSDRWSFSASTADGSPARVDFFNRKLNKDGQMEVSQNKPPYGAWQTATNWSYRLAIPNGGFIETRDEFPFEAPEFGYQSVVEFKYQKGETNWTERLNKTFYIVFGNPRKYGRVHVETSMTTGTILEYAINPDGSRYLEPK